VLNPNGPHPGDLPNVHVQEDGIAHAEFFVSDIALSGDAGTVILDDDGAAFIIHAGADDYMTDPAGNSGDRIACGVIDAAN
jgi:superoxide dismutase, Cu-Zn family